MLQQGYNNSSSAVTGTQKVDLVRVPKMKARIRVPKKKILTAWWFFLEVVRRQSF